MAGYPRQCCVLQIQPRLSMHGWGLRRPHRKHISGRMTTILACAGIAAPCVALRIRGDQANPIADLSSIIVAAIFAATIPTGAPK
jgi:hypothetical protein